jgi:hypothetical protein
MKTTKWLVGLIVVGIVMICSAARAQGNVTFTPIDQAAFKSYLSQSAWVALVDTRGNVGFSSNPSSLVGYDGGAAQNTSVSLTELNGNVTITTIINYGLGPVAGETTSSIIESLTPISGLAIGIISPHQSSGGIATVDNWYIGSSYQSPVAGTSSASFGGMAGTFEYQTNYFASTFSLETPFDSSSQIYIVGYSMEPAPEPCIAAFIGLAGLALFVAKHKK